MGEVKTKDEEASDRSPVLYFKFTIQIPLWFDTEHSS